MPWTLGPEFRKAREAVARSTAPINICDGPVRSGKTVGFNIRWLEYVATAPPGDLLMWGKTERTLLRNIVRPMQDEYGSSIVQIKQGDGLVVIAGRPVYLVGANDERAENKIRGMTLAGAYGDELTLTPENFWNMLITRLSVDDAKVFGTTNPGPPRHYLKREWLDAGAAKGVRRFQFKLADNPALEADYVNRLKASFSGLFYRRMILGEWVAAEGAVFPGFDPDLHLIAASDVPRDLTHVGVGVDYGAANPFAALLVGWGGADGRVYVLDGYYHDGKTKGPKTDAEYAQAVGVLTARYARSAPYDPSLLFRDPVVVDPSALGFATTLRRLGYDVRSADNRRQYGVNLLGLLLDNDRLRIVNTEAGQALADEFGSYVWDEKKQALGVDDPSKSDDHAIDALRYVVATLLPYIASTPDGESPDDTEFRVLR